MTALADAVREFHDIAWKYREFGAADTEPRTEFTILIENAREGHRSRLPRTIRDWQLFDREIMGKPGAGKAAQALTRAAKRAQELALAEHRELVRAGW